MKKRIVIPGGLHRSRHGPLALGDLRGNWTDPQARNPSSAADGVVTQLIRTPEGRKQIRRRSHRERSARSVWKVVTDYDHFSDVFRILPRRRASRPRWAWHVTGEIRSIVRSLAKWTPCAHEESAPRFVASWDEPHGAWKINRGSWGVTPHAPVETLLEYNLELRVSPFPDFVVRAVLLDQLKPVMGAVASRVQRDQSPR